MSQDENKAMKPESLLERILREGIEIVQKPFVIKRIKRAFESAKDSYEEQLIENEASKNKIRERLVEAGKNSEPNLHVYLTELVQCQEVDKLLRSNLSALEKEHTEFLG